MEINRDGKVEIDYKKVSDKLVISHLYVREKDRREGLATETLNELYEKYDDVEEIQISIKGNRSTKKFLEDNGFNITFFNPGRRIRGHKKINK